MDHFFRDLPSDCGQLLQVHHLIAAEKNVDPLRHDWVKGNGRSMFFFSPRGGYRAGYIS